MLIKLLPQFVEDMYSIDQFMLEVTYENYNYRGNAPTFDVIYFRKYERKYRSTANEFKVLMPSKSIPAIDYYSSKDKLFREWMSPLYDTSSIPVMYSFLHVGKTLRLVRHTPC